MEKERAEKGDGIADEEVDEDAGWEGWDAETDSSESVSSGGWQDVESDGAEDFEISDSDDEKSKKKDSAKEDVSEPVPMVEDGTSAMETKSVTQTSTMATTKVCISVLCVCP